MECGINNFVFFEGQRKQAADWSKLGRFQALYQTPTGSIVNEKEGKQVARVHAVAGPDDLKHFEAALLGLARAGQEGRPPAANTGALGDIAIMDASDWKVIPAGAFSRTEHTCTCVCMHARLVCAPVLLAPPNPLAPIRTPRRGPVWTEDDGAAPAPLSLLRVVQIVPTALPSCVPAVPLCCRPCFCLDPKFAKTMLLRRLSAEQAPARAPRAAASSSCGKLAPGTLFP